jgi:phenylalanine-4-hydroxylase
MGVVAATQARSHTGKRGPHQRVRALQRETTRRYGVSQRHPEYSAEEHETWRLLLARTESLVRQFERQLHPAYVEGFRQLVLPWTSIPRLDEVNAALSRFGWTTLCVEGCLPPEVYAGLMACGIFPIARDIRSREQLAFSPTPDLAHDMLGHIPMLVSPEHCRFLRRIALATACTSPNPLDCELYDAHLQLGAARSAAEHCVRSLSAAEARVQAAQSALLAAPSPLAQLDRTYLWSIEFGLMGTPADFCIYGAGLLSAPGEVEQLCTRGAPIFDFSLSAAQRGINFSDYQSAYFLARDYAQLHETLSQLEASWTGVA